MISRAGRARIDARRLWIGEAGWSVASNRLKHRDTKAPNAAAGRIAAKAPGSSVGAGRVVGEATIARPPKKAK